MKTLLVGCAFLIVASAGADCLPSKPYVGLFADGGRSIMSVNYAGTSTQFELWLWWLPSEHGMISALFRMTYPANVIQSTVTTNPIRASVIGCDWWVDWICVNFGDCQEEWIWSHHQTCFLTDALPNVIEIDPLAGKTVIELDNCMAGYSPEPVTVLNKLGLNQGGIIAVEPESWGAIKSLYR